MELRPEILEFYESQYVEDDRLQRSPHGRLEFARTQELLRRLLPAAGHGARPGRHRGSSPGHVR